AVCEDNSGFWWGEGHDDVSQFDGDQSIPSYHTCAEVNQARHDNGVADQDLYTILPDQSAAVRNEQYKLVRNTFTRFDPAQRPDANGGIHVEQEYEFYKI